MDTPSTADIRKPSNAAPKPPPPARFRVVRPHADGGLGRVSVAVDEQLRREVALKEIHERHADDAINRLRFLREAEITGRLEHPGVVPVYGLDADEQGRPRYAMRFVRGQSLDEAIHRYYDAGVHRDPTRRALALRGLLTRFVVVCQTVAYAHSRGVIHRDLKPANVMLGEFGETLVVDWGLARVLQGSEGGSQMEEAQRETPCCSDVTQQGQVVGTLAYLPPEQARGENAAVGVATDIWALGAMLYSVLTGLPPYRGDRADALERARRGEVVPARLAGGGVPPALSAICEKAMAPTPAGRYSSAADLAGEVERFLADEPIYAYHEPLAGRLWRWGRRHRTLVAAFGVLLVTAVVGLSAGLAAVNAERRETAQQRDQANENLGRATAAEREASSNFDEAWEAVERCLTMGHDDPRFQDPKLREVRRDLMLKAVPFLDRFSRQRPDHPLVPRQAVWLFRVGQVEEEMGLRPESIKSYAASRDILARLSDADPANANYRRDLANAWGSLGNALSDDNQAEALRCYAMARDLQERLAGEQPDAAQYRAGLSRTLNNLGQLRAEMGDPKSARADYERALGLLRRLTADQPRDTESWVGLAHTWDKLAVLRQQEGRFAEALADYERARELLTRLIREKRGEANAEMVLAVVGANIAGLHRDAGRLAESVAAYDAALRGLEAARRRWDDHLGARVLTRNLHFGRATSLIQFGRWGEAADDLERAAQLDPGPDLPYFRSQRAVALEQAGDHAGAAALAAQLASTGGATPAALNDLAITCGLAASAAEGDLARPLARRAKLAADYREQSLALLERARLGGHYRDPKARESLNTESASAHFAAWPTSRSCWAAFGVRNERLG